MSDKTDWHTSLEYYILRFMGMVIVYCMIGYTFGCPFYVKVDGVQHVITVGSGGQP